jgi:TP901-1 family phage major tail protein
MATAGKVNGTKIGFYSGSTLVASATSHTLGIEANMIDVSNKDSLGWAEFIPGQRSWTIDGDFVFHFDATYGLDDFFDAMINRTALTVKLSTEVTGDFYFTGTAYPTSTSLEAPMEDATTYSASFQGTGVLTKSTVA